MQPEHFNELAELEDSYWWHVAKRQLIVELLQRHAPPPGLLVEGGIGSSRNLVEFQQLGYDVHGFDIAQEAVNYGHEKGLDGVQIHDLEEPWPIETPIKAVVLLDVIEHVADPAVVLRNASSRLTADGAIFVTVPAYPWLFSDWDSKLGHHRRYTVSTLRQNAADSGLKLSWVRHWNSFTLPAAIASRGIDRLFGRRSDASFPRVSSSVNSLLLRFAGLERRLLLNCGLPVGLSIVGVLKHADSPAS